MTRGDWEVLWVLMTLQYLAEMGPKNPPPGHMAHNVQLVMRPLKQAEISFMPDTVFGYSTSVDQVFQLTLTHHHYL